MNRTPHFSLFGVPVRIDPMFFIIPLLSLQSRDTQGAIIWTVLVFTGVLLHELGHLRGEDDSELAARGLE